MEVVLILKKNYSQDKRLKLGALTVSAYFLSLKFFITLILILITCSLLYNSRTGRSCVVLQQDAVEIEAGDVIDDLAFRLHVQLNPGFATCPDETGQLQQY